MKQYLELLKDIRDNGQERKDRTGVGTKSVFGRQMRFDLQKGFPAVTTKKLFFKGVVVELLWFLRGDTNVKYLHEHGVHIWDSWQEADGEVPNIYGKQWRRWESTEGTVDQIERVIGEIRNNPNSRRAVVSAWNAGETEKMALPPCHTLFHFYVVNNKLSCQLYQRSADFAIGVPFNIASYSLLTHMIAQECGLDVGEFIHTFGDAHIYLNHLDAVEEQLTRKPRELPVLWLNPEIKKVDDFKLEDIKLLNYNPHPTIKMPIAV